MRRIIALAFVVLAASIHMFAQEDFGPYEVDTVADIEWDESSGYIYADCSEQLDYNTQYYYSGGAECYIEKNNNYNDIYDNSLGFDPANVEINLYLNPNDQTAAYSIVGIFWLNPLYFSAPVPCDPDYQDCSSQYYDALDYLYFDGDVSDDWWYFFGGDDTSPEYEPSDTVALGDLTAVATKGSPLLTSACLSDPFSNFAVRLEASWGKFGACVLSDTLQIPISLSPLCKTRADDVSCYAYTDSSGCVNQICPGKTRKIDGCPNNPQFDSKIFPTESSQVCSSVR